MKECTKDVTDTELGTAWNPNGYCYFCGHRHE